MTARPPIRQMAGIVVPLLAIGIAVPVVAALASERASVYVLPIPKDASRLAAELGNAPMPIPADAMFTIVIDDTHTVTVDTNRGAVIDNLETGRRHSVRVTLNGKPYARFKFSFDGNWGFGEGPKRLAIYMDAMYSTWRVWRCDRVRRCDDVRAGGTPDASSGR